jgi:ATP-dependent protease ClpP protease subunit|nr:MAG TPA_asm: Putative ATP dependent Clp protease [Caudoviricetes sp.]
MKISIRGPIVSSNQHRFYQFYGMEATSPRSVADALAKGNGERAEVEINSGGGEIFAASEIYTALRSYAGGVIVRIVGLAASAASIIAMAGESEMTPTGMMMIHNVQTEASGDYRQMEHTAGTLRDANHAIISAYIAKTGRPEAEIAAMMDAETWITAERAVELGLVDRVMQPDTGQKPLAADFYSGMLSEDALRRAENFLKGKAAEPDFFMPERAQAEAKLKFLKLKGELK